MDTPAWANATPVAPSIFAAACEELGTMFIKLGQALSTRGDLLPDAYRKELAKLQDEVAPVPANVIADIIHEDLGKRPDQLFAFFDLTPLGSASIGQVHAGRLLDRREVRAERCELRISKRKSVWETPTDD
jgi:ubiquinone biosynthesis protein